MKRIVSVAAVVVMLCAPGAVAQVGAPSQGDCRMRLRELRTSIRVRFAMYTDTSGRDWRFKVRDGRRFVFRGVYTTDADGDFVSRTSIRRRPGYRRYEGRAAEIGTGVVCRVVLRT